MEKAAMQGQQLGFSLLLYGPPGVGKTTVASQFPKPLAYANLEGGARWLYHGLDGIDRYDLGDSESPTDGLQALIKAQARNYRSLVIDSASSLRSRRLDQLAGNSDEGNKISDHYKVAAFFRRNLLQLQYLPLVVIWITQDEIDTSPGKMLTKPAGISDTNLDDFTKYVDAMVYMGYRTSASSEPVRFLLSAAYNPTGGRSSILTKDRTGLLPEIIDLPGLDKDGNPPDMVTEFFGRAISEVFPDSGKTQKKKGK